MKAERHKKTLGFPEPLLGRKGMRIPVIAETDQYLALNKPVGIVVRQHPWDEGLPNLDQALNHQLAANRQEFLATAAKVFASVYYLDRVISGVSLFAKSKSAWAELKNYTGSGLNEFRFLLIAVAEASVEEAIVCEVPILPHRYKAKMVPSSAKGKRATTTFQCLKTGREGWSLWEARTHFFRPHQIRLHAALSGLKLMNESLYAGQEAPTYAAVGKRKKSSDFERQIFEPTALHLAELRLNSEEFESTVIEAPLAKAFLGALHCLDMKP